MISPGSLNPKYIQHLFTKCKPLITTLAYHPHSEGDNVCLCVSLSICQQDNSWTAHDRLIENCSGVVLASCVIVFIVTIPSLGLAFTGIVECRQLI